MTINYSNFPKEFTSKIVTIDEAFKKIKDGDRIVTAMAAAEPTMFFSSLEKQAMEHKNLRVYCANPSQAYPCFTNNKLAGHLELATMFLTNPLRKEQGHGVVHYVPQHLSQWAKHLTCRDEIDIFWGTCTPPNKHGFVNLGPNACYEQEILRKAKYVILEINHEMPFTYGTTHIPSSWVNQFIKNTHPLLTIDRPILTEKDQQIASYVADLVHNRSTIQLGIGAIPNAIGEALSNKKDLGVHTEMINDTIMDLYRKGVITGRYKTMWEGKIVGSFALGSQDLYDFIDKNPAIEMQPSSLVNDPYRIGRNHRMVSINSALEVDLTGQVCSESIGHRELSGVGGASDTHTGAQRSVGGRGIIAMYSTTKNDTRSKIAFELQPGAKVTISRNDVDTIVTEYGIAELAGKSVRDRTKSLIACAHPKFREELMFKAKEYKYI